MRRDGRGITDTVFSASANSRVCRFYGATRYPVIDFNVAAYTLDNSRHIVCVEYTNAVTITLPSASAGDTDMHTGVGTVLGIKDYVKSRTGAGNNITLTGSPGSDVLIDHEGTYVLTGTMPAISLFSNGTSWFVF